MAILSVRAIMGALPWPPSGAAIHGTGTCKWTSRWNAFTPGAARIGGALIGVATIDKRLVLGSTMFGGLGPGGLLPRTGPDGARHGRAQGAAVRGGDAGRHGHLRGAGAQADRPAVDRRGDNGRPPRLGAGHDLQNSSSNLSRAPPYLLGCEETGQAVLVDPVINAMDRDMQVLQELGLRLAYTLDTHIHADHHLGTGAEEAHRQPDRRAGDRPPAVRTSAWKKPRRWRWALSASAACTPGHTDGHFSYVLGDRVFTGDALLIDGCGRTDFQNGDSRVLFDSVTQAVRAARRDAGLSGPRLLGPVFSSIAQEKTRNPRLGGGKTLEEFTAIMASLNLPYPKFIDHAVPGNKACGECPTNLPQELQKYCGQMAESPQGEPRRRPAGRHAHPLSRQRQLVQQLRQHPLLGERQGVEACPLRGEQGLRELGDQPLRGPCHAQVLAAAIPLVHLAQDEAAGAAARGWK